VKWVRFFFYHRAGYSGPNKLNRRNQPGQPSADYDNFSQKNISCFKMALKISRFPSKQFPFPDGLKIARNLFGSKVV